MSHRASNVIDIFELCDDLSPWAAHLLVLVQVVHVTVETFKAESILVSDLIFHLVSVEHHVVAAHADMLGGHLVELLQEKQLITPGIGNLKS